MSRKIPEYLTEQEVVQIIKATKKRHHKLAFMLAFYQAMRISEVTKLTKENIDFKQRLIKIKSGKGNKDRNIPIMPQVVRLLKRELELLPLKCGVRALQMQFKKVCKQELGKDLHFHNLRHSGATWLMNVHKWDTRHVQVFLGHSNLNTTQIYTHVSAQNLIELAYGEK